MQHRVYDTDGNLVKTFSDSAAGKYLAMCYVTENGGSYKLEPENIEEEDMMNGHPYPGHEMYD